MSDDIVAELDRWREWYTTDPEALAVIRRARDEIVALRKDRDVMTDEPNRNGIREALQRYFAADYQPKKLSREDHLLAWLWQEGYRIVPLVDDKEPS